MALQELRLAHSNDLEWIASLERRPEFREFVLCWPMPEHQSNLNNSDYRYIILVQSDSDIGFAVLRGFSKSPDSIELVRIIVEDPGQGLGRLFLRQLLTEILADPSVNRIWLDVYDTNARAIHVYEKAGFQKTGKSVGDSQPREGGRRLQVMALERENYRQ